MLGQTSSASLRRRRAPSSPSSSSAIFRRPRPQFFVFLLIFCTLLYYYTPLPFFFILSPSSLSSSSSSTTFKAHGGGGLEAFERLTLVVIWTGLKVPSYLAMFLRSVEANKGRVDLVFVAKRDESEAGGGRCVDLGETGNNIRSVCLSNFEYWTLHQEYLCDRWKCNEQEKEELMEVLLHRGREDYIHSHFRVLRGPIMQRHFLDKKSKWWGWCDTDVVLGNFERQFPWDIAHKFDLIQPTHQTEAKEILVYLRGHMTMFQTRPSTLKKLHTFPAFESFESYKNGKLPVTAMEEEDFSTFFFHTNPQVTFLTYDALLSGHFVSSALSPHLISLMHTQGPPDFTLPLPLPEPISAHNPRLPTFSDSPLANGVVRLDLGMTKEPVWFPREGAVSYVPLELKKGAGAGRTFLVKEVPGGVVRERVESWTRWELKGPQKGVREGLYQHFQMTKKQEWFVNLPPNPLAKGQLLTIAGFHDAEIRAGSKLVWKGGKKAEEEKAKALAALS